jgi:hypothetical protein
MLDAGCVGKDLVFVFCNFACPTVRLSACPLVCLSSCPPVRLIAIFLDKNSH